MRQLNDKPGLASFLTVVLLFAGPALRAGDQPSEPHGPADLPKVEDASLTEPAIDGEALRVTAARDSRALGPLSIGTPDAGLLLNPVPFPEGAFWKVRELRNFR